MKKQVVLGLCLLCSSAAFGMENKLFEKIEDNRWTTKDGLTNVTKINDEVFVVHNERNPQTKLIEPTILTFKDNGNGFEKIDSDKHKRGRSLHYFPFKDEERSPLKLFELFLKEHGSELGNGLKK
jgi:hypothetical protein